MRRTQRVVMAGMALMIGAAACGGSNGGSAAGSAGASSSKGSTGSASGTCTPSSPCTINYWTEQVAPQYQAAFKPMVAAFNKSHPGTTVVVRYVATDIRAVLRQGFSAGKPPEIFDQEGYTDVFDYVQKKQLLDVSDWWNKPGNGDRFAPSTLASVKYEDGKIYGIPELVLAANQIWYNKKVLASNGIDPAQLKKGTWDDYLAAFAKLKSAGVTPLAYGAKDGFIGPEWYYSFFGKLAGGNHMMELSAGNCGYKWTDPVSVKAAQMYIDLNDKGYFSKGAAGRDWNASNAEFLAGKSAFYFMGTWFDPNVLGVPNNKDFGLLTFPNVPGGKSGQETQLIAPQGFALTQSAADPGKKAAALAFIDSVNNAANQEILNKGAGEVSAVSAANTPDSLNEYSKVVATEQLVPASQPYTFLEHATTIATGENALFKGSVGVLTGEKTAKSWMEDVQKADDSTKGQNSYKRAPDCKG